MRLLFILLADMLCVAHVFFGHAIAAERPADGVVVRKIIDTRSAGSNLLKDDAWRPWQKGFGRTGDVFVCSNGADSALQSGVSQHVALNQAEPAPIVAVAWSKADGVGGGRDSDYSLYMDLQYMDGTPLWGQVAMFDVGSHDWQRRQVLVVPEKPVKSVSFHMLLRKHAGTASFRDPELRAVALPSGCGLFDHLPVAVGSGDGIKEGFLLRDVAAGSDFVNLERSALGVNLDVKRSHINGAEMFDVVLKSVGTVDQAVTLVYRTKFDPAGAKWLDNPRHATPVKVPGQYMNSVRFNAGANSQLSRYPFAAVANGSKGEALGIDMARPAFFRAGYSSAAGELFLAWDVSLTPEKPSASLRFCRFKFDPAWQFRGALSRYYAIFPEAFRCRTREQGLWMPFAKISAVKGWEDFGFKFKEGNGETAWDDHHGILTFRYTEPMTWWMKMSRELPRTMESAVAEAQRLADGGNKEAKALFASGYRDESGKYPARLQDTPWCNGAVWSMNSMPGVPGEITDFKLKWSAVIRDQLYGPKRKGDLDGEYIDSSEGYVTDELNFRRDHFAAADTPLAFSPENYKPAIFRGLNVFEYVRAIAKDVHGMDKFMMANGTPGGLCWLAPLLDVMGTETDWNHQGRWQPMSDTELLYRRALCKGKPYCFLMNTDFDKFSPELVEKYMKRCLAYGMFPGFFSHNASEKQYFTNPALYNRDRPLFIKYVPLCRKVSEAGWEPVTLALSSNEKVHVERFGANLLTVFNDSDIGQKAVITVQGLPAGYCNDLLTGMRHEFKGKDIAVDLAGGDVAVMELK